MLLAAACLWAAGAGSLSAEESAPLPAPASQEGNRLVVLPEFAEEIRSVAFFPDGERIAVAGAGPVTSVFEVRDAKRLLTFAGHGAVTRKVAFSRDGRLMATCGADNQIRIFDVLAAFKDQGRSPQPPAEPLNPLRQLTGHNASVNALAFSPDGSRLVSASDDASLIYWDVASGEALRTMTGHAAAIEGLDFSADGRTLLSEAGDVTARLWDAPSGRLLQVLQERDGSIAAVALSPDGQWGVTTRGDFSWHLFEVREGADVLVLSGQRGYGSCAKFAPDSLSLWTGSNDGTLRQWDLFSGREIRFLSLEGEKILALDLDPAGRRLAIGTKRKVFIWNIEEPPGPAAEGLPAKAGRLEAAWEALASASYSTRLQGVAQLLAGGEKAVEFLAQRLAPPAVPADEATVRDLVAGLADPRYGARQRASETLLAMGSAIHPLLRRHLEQAAPEVRERLAYLLFSAEGRAAAIRITLALESLGWLRLDSARKLLQKIAAGNREDPLTSRAAAVLARWPAAP